MSDLSKTSQKIQTARDLTLPDGTVNLDLLVGSIHLSWTELAGILGISRDAVSRSARLRSKASQRKLRDLVEILGRIGPAGLRLVHISAASVLRPADGRGPPARGPGRRGEGLHLEVGGQRSRVRLPARNRIPLPANLKTIGNSVKSSDTHPAARAGETAGQGAA